MSDEQVSIMELNNHTSDPFDEVQETGYTNDVSEESVDENASDIEASDDKSDGAAPEDVANAAESIEELDESKQEAKEGESAEETQEATSEQEPEADVKTRLDEFNKQIEEGSLEIDIDGEKVTLKDLKNDRIGQKEISRRFTEIDRTKKQLEADTNEINEYVNEFASKMKDGDSVGAMQFLGQFAGVPPYMIKEQLIAALAPEIMRRAELNPIQLQNEYLNEQNTYLQEQRESDSKRQAAEQANMEFQNSIKELRETNSIDEDTWNEAVRELSETQKDENLTPELVVKAINYNRIYTQADSVVKSFDEQLDNPEQWIEQLVDVKEKYPDFTDEDLKEVLKNAYNQVKSSSVEERMKEKVESKQIPTKTTKPKQTNEIDEDLLDW